MLKLLEEELGSDPHFSINISKIYHQNSHYEGCPTITLSHQRVTGASKRATNQNIKALFNWEFFATHDKLSLSDI